MISALNKNTKNSIILIILVIFLVGLLLWEIWPDRIETAYLVFENKPIQ